MLINILHYSGSNTSPTYQLQEENWFYYTCIEEPSIHFEQFFITDTKLIEFNRLNSQILEINWLKNLFNQYQPSKYIMYNLCLPELKLEINMYKWNFTAVYRTCVHYM